MVTFTANGEEFYHATATRESTEAFASALSLVHHDLRDGQHHPAKSLNPIIVEQGFFRFLCVSDVARPVVDLSQTRTDVLDLVLNIHASPATSRLSNQSSNRDGRQVLEKTRIVQVVGDSTPFPEQSAQRAVTVLQDIICAEEVLLYGATASADNTDANGIVNRLLDPGRHPADQYEESDRSPRHISAVGNVVVESIRAIQDWNCIISPEVQNFVFVWNSHMGTRFGDDTWISDGIMDGEKGDRMVCFEGGVQSFEQIVNVLLRKCLVTGLTGFREHKDVRFSAAGLLALMKVQYEEDSTTEEMSRVVWTYVDGCPDLRGSQNSGKRTRIERETKRLLEYPDMLKRVVIVPTAEM